MASRSRSSTAIVCRACGSTRARDAGRGTKIFSTQLDLTPNTSRQKINLPANQKGYDNSEITVGKLSARTIQIF